MPKSKPKPPTQQEQITLIMRINELVQEGHSIVFARRKICGSQNSLKNRAVLRHPLYLHVLNKYMFDRGFNRSFYDNGQRLKQKGPVK